ncbi:MAG TPA: hypothetical protein VGD40_10115 [Chryseosolibacter sp.]
MKPREFTLNNLLQFPFSANRVTSTAIALRQVGLFPKGNKHDHYTHVSVDEAAIFLYLLASETPAEHIKVNLEMLSNFVDSRGEYFYNHFTALLKEPALLETVSSIEVGSQLRFAVINYKNGTTVKFADNANFPDNLIRKTCEMPFSFLADFCIDLFKLDYDRAYGEDKVTTLKATHLKAPEEIFNDKPDLRTLKAIIKDWENIKEA